MTQDLADQPASKAPGVVAVGRNGGQEFAQDFFGGDQRGVRNIRCAGGLGPFIARDKNGEPIERIGEDPPHRFGNP